MLRYWLKPYIPLMEQSFIYPYSQIPLYTLIGLKKKKKKKKKKKNNVTRMYQNKLTK